ncbi:hypothetical protein RRG08_036705 [Elysia crispata]|uniref:Uncharacterized protein n=1 Tax=Elysia crispata TaxID=231223 RepID=A0AAE1CMJ1_9GAST|nr:hypothetical protein RRG08_036705 [Elysia crispata]
MSLTPSLNGRKVSTWRGSSQSLDRLNENWHISLGQTTRVRAGQRRMAREAGVEEHGKIKINSTFQEESLERLMIEPVSRFPSFRLPFESTYARDL